MRFTAKTIEEIQESKLLPDGQYLAEVIASKDKVSKAGNEMIELELRIYDSKDRAHFVYDFLMESMEYKLIHFCEFTGLKEKYDAGLLMAEDCFFKKVHVDIYTQVDKNGVYAPKNSVKDYLSSGAAPEAKTEDFFNDEITF